MIHRFSRIAELALLRPLFNKNFRVFFHKSVVGGWVTFMAEFSDFRSSRLSDLAGLGGMSGGGKLGARWWIAPAFASRLAARPSALCSSPWLLIYLRVRLYLLTYSRAFPIISRWRFVVANISEYFVVPRYYNIKYFLNCIVIIEQSKSNKKS